jgi:hypothetical protein
MAYPFRITPSLGPDVTQKVAPGAFYDGQAATDPSPQLGSVVRGADGGEYFWVKASGTIAATSTTGTQVTLTPATKTVATGNGGFYTPPGLAVALNECVWVRRGAWDANPS